MCRRTTHSAAHSRGSTTFHSSSSAHSSCSTSSSASSAGQYSPLVSLHRLGPCIYRHFHLSLKTKNGIVNIRYSVKNSANYGIYTNLPTKYLCVNIHCISATPCCLYCSITHLLFTRIGSTNSLLDATQIKPNFGIRLHFVFDGQLSTELQLASLVLHLSLFGRETVTIKTRLSYGSDFFYITQTKVSIK